ncbi:hypothetical protein QQM79_02555 [Marinobacteraceae bacterium S3BR75-40.1]
MALLHGLLHNKHFTTADTRPMAADEEDSSKAPGTAPEAPIVKAGCGIRFDPDQLSEDTGFDFSDAQKLKARLKRYQGSNDEEE